MRIFFTTTTLAVPPIPAIWFVLYGSTPSESLVCLICTTLCVGTAAAKEEMERKKKSYLVFVSFVPLPLLGGSPPGLVVGLQFAIGGGAGFDVTVAAVPVKGRLWWR